jgi:alcohol dehydrogenase (cytochrome c)
MLGGALAVVVFAAYGTAQQAPAKGSPSTTPPEFVPVPKALQHYKPVTAGRLTHPEDGDWLMIRRTYDGWGYSPLTQITRDNVRRLQPAWMFSTGVANGHEAPPIVNNGVMFVATPGNQVVAIDAKTGVVLWRYRRPLPEGAIVQHPTTRGVALYGDRVFFASNAAVLVALDARTGKEVWTAAVEENKNGYYLTAAPLVADGKVMVGTAGGERGIRGFVAAYDAETGKEAWRAFTIPAPGEPGSETWPPGDAWKTGGGSTWVTGNYDPATNLVYWGVGNGGPWMGDQRQGDNLYLSSTIAIDAATGAIKGHQQYEPNESWDWDEVSPPLLIDYKRGSRTVKGLINVARNGYMFYLERTDGRINFVDANPYVKQNVFLGVDPKTGRPEIDPDRKPGTGKKADFCPTWWGGKNWPPAAFSPQTRLIYVPTQENLCATMIGRKVEYRAGGSFTGATTELYIAPGAKHISEVQAWNVDTGKKVWTHEFTNSANWGGMLATAGGLVFSGGTADRMFRAFDASTGELLWEFPTSSGIMAPPSSFTVDGKQYIAVVSGWGIDPRSMQNRLNRVRPGEFPEVPEGGSIWVFAVK